MVFEKSNHLRLWKCICGHLWVTENEAAAECKSELSNLHKYLRGNNCLELALLKLYIQYIL